MKILIIGPFPNPIIGVSFANQTLFNGLKKKNLCVKKINTQYSNEVKSSFGKFNFSKLSFIKIYLEFYKIFSSNVIYMTPGQSFGGVLKYFPFILISKLSRKKTVFHLHGNYLKEEYNSLKGVKKIIFKKIISSFDYAIVLSESLKANFYDFLDNKKIYTVVNCFDDELIHYSKNFNLKNYSKIRIIFLSNLIEEKGINVLLKALIELKKEGIEIPTEIAGHRIYENEIRDVLTSLPFVKYLGVVQGEEKAIALWNSNVFCLPTYFSKGEGQPISIIEAMAFGNLIVTTKHGGIPDICTENNGEFVEKNDVKSLKDTLKKLYLNPQIIEEKGKYNASIAPNLYSEKKFINSILIILKNAVQTK